MSRPIRFSKVSKSFQSARTGRREPVLRDFDFEIASGELVAVVGPSGVGKSTLLHLAAGLDVPDRGSVDRGDSSKPRLGMVFQQPRLLEWLSVRRNVILAAESAGQDAAQADRLIRAVGLADYENAYPLTLSGGQRQRVALARAFSVAPEFVLLDEPFSALDELTARRLRLLLQDFWLDHPPTGLLVTHNTQEAAFLADRILLLGGRPARAVEVIEVNVNRPRSPEDPALFDIHRRIISQLQ